MNRLFTTVLTIGIAVLLNLVGLRCAGGSTETFDFMIKGIIYLPSGDPGVDADVFLHATDLLADTSQASAKVLADLPISRNTKTNDAGEYTFENVEQGEYLVEASFGDTLKSVTKIIEVATKAVEDLVLPVGASVVSSGVLRIISLDQDTVMSVGEITGTIKLPHGGTFDKVYVLASGINRFAQPDSTDMFLFDKLAPGQYDLRIVTSLDFYREQGLFGIMVYSDSTTSVGSIELTYVNPNDTSQFKTLTDLADAYFGCLTSASPCDSLAKRFVVSQNEFQEIINDTARYYYTFTIDHGITRYIIFDTSWTKDTVTAEIIRADTSNPGTSKYLVGSRVYIIDSLPSIETVEGTILRQFDFQADAVDSFTILTSRLRDSLSGLGAVFHSFGGDGGDVTPSILEPGVDHPELRNAIVGKRNGFIRFQWKSGQQTLGRSMGFAALLAQTSKGWKVVLPANFVPFVPITDSATYTPAPPFVDKAVSLVGRWETTDYQGAEVQFNDDESFVYDKDDFSYPFPTLKGTYSVLHNYTHTYDTPMVVGQFAYRDTANRNRWILTPSGQYDTIAITDSIIYPDMANPDPTENPDWSTVDSIRVATWPIWVYSATVDTITSALFDLVLCLYWQKGAGIDSVYYTMAQRGRQGTDIDSLYIGEKLKGSDKLEHKAFRRLTSTSNPDWGGIWDSYQAKIKRE